MTLTLPSKKSRNGDKTSIHHGEESHFRGGTAVEEGPGGHRHPNTSARKSVERISGEGKTEVEYDHVQLQKLNIPDGHPAKDEQDTFYVNKDIVLRTQTTPVFRRE